MRIRFRTIAYLVLAFMFSISFAGAYEDFFSAVARDDADTVGSLLQRGFDPNSLDEQGQFGLFLALREGSSKVVERLLQSPQLKIDVPNAFGETPLMMAALKGRADWARRLLELGATADRAGWTPLHYAASGPDATLVTLLLDHGARIDARSPNGSTALMMAARYGSEASVQLLLARGADPGLRNQRGMTAADFARGAGRDRLAALLEPSTR